MQEKHTLLSVVVFERRGEIMKIKCCGLDMLLHRGMDGNGAGWNETRKLYMELKNVPNKQTSGEVTSLSQP